MTWNVRLSLRGGAPSSVTAAVMIFVDAAWAREGVQEKVPLLGLTRAPAGAPGPRLNRKACAGRSGSVADMVTRNGARTSADKSGMAASVGVWLAGSTWRFAVKVAGGTNAFVATDTTTE